MTNPATHPPNPLEDTLAQALEVLETAGREALESFLRERPQAAPRLREALADLKLLDVLEAAAPPMPELLGEFRLRGQLGAGGMGVVFLAEQQSLRREVALKVVRPELLFFEGARERFRREIEAVARLEHPSIVPILATGQADGVPYYAMPRIRGRSADAVLKEFAGRDPDDLDGEALRQVLAESPGDAAAGSDPAGTFAGAYWRSVVRLVRQAALGIAHAHARGILHRDLKPSNLMFTPDGRAVVLDFGLALARGNTQLTQAGSQPGSPAYMAPEQVRGEPADERTDVYGLAATLHSLLGLRPPFAATETEVLRAQIVAGQRQDLRHHRALPAELRLVLDTALDVDRARRYAGPQAFADDLQAVLDGRAIAVRRLPVRVRLRRFARRHRALTTAVGALALFVVALPAALWWQARAANELLQRQVARADRALAVSLDAVERLLASVARDRLRHAPAALEIAAMQLRDACALFARIEVEAALAERVVRLHFDSLLHLAQIEAVRGDQRAAAAATERAIALCGDPPANALLRLRRAIATNRLVGHLLDGGRDAELGDLPRRALVELQQFAAGSASPELARQHLPDAHYHLAVLAERHQDAAAHEHHLREAVAAAAAAGDRLAHAGLQLQMARRLRQSQQFAAARERIAAALETASDPTLPERGWPIPRGIAAEAWFQLGLLEEAGGSAEAAKAAHRAAEVRFDEILRDYPEDATMRSMRGACRHHLANLMVRDGDHRGARALAEAAIADQRAALRRMPTFAAAHLHLGEHLRTLCHCLRQLDDLPALEDAARELGAMAGSPAFPLTAARSLLRCAEAVPERAAALRVEALDLLVEARQRGARVQGEDPLYAPLREDPRFEALLGSAGGR